MLIAQVATTLQRVNSSFVGKVVFLVCLFVFCNLKKVKRYVPSSFTPEILVGNPKLKILSLTGTLSFVFFSYRIQSWELLSK